jgi:pimeloyl-ACP methyl ester carboxylesterase
MEAELGMHYYTFNGAGGDRLAFQSSLPLGQDPSVSVPDSRQSRVLVLIHGFSGSSSYFTRNFSALSESHWVVAPDLRGHGRSCKSAGRHHVAALASDLRHLVEHVRALAGRAGGQTVKIVPVGCSIGAAILWTYVELFGDADFAGMAFVDQAPLQDVSTLPLASPWDRSRSHRGCYDEQSLAAAQYAWVHTPADAHHGLVADCLGYRYAPPEDANDPRLARAGEDEAFFTSISALCKGEWLARLLADHTRYDHREDLAHITKPSLVVAGRSTGCFPLESIGEVATRINAGATGGNRRLARYVVLDGGHWMFYEEPDKFNSTILDFAQKCMGA